MILLDFPNLTSVDYKLKHTHTVVLSHFRKPYGYLHVFPFCLKFTSVLGHPVFLMYQGRAGNLTGSRRSYSVYKKRV